MESVRSIESKQELITKYVIQKFHEGKGPNGSWNDPDNINDQLCAVKGGNKMCMKYVNATVSCYDSIEKVNNKVLSLNLPFSTIDVEDKDPSICSFIVTTAISIRGTNNESERANNPIESNTNLDFVIRLTKCDSDINKRRYIDLDRFTIDLQDVKVSQACFRFVNYSRVTEVERLKLPEGLGKYVIKVLVKKSEDSDDKFSIQSMYGITIE